MVLDGNSAREMLLTRRKHFLQIEHMPEGNDALKPEEISRREYYTHSEIKLTYEGEPGERIPAYLLIPRNRQKAKIPAIFAAHQCACLCDIGKEQVVGKVLELPEQAYGLELVREGFIVLAPDANKVGERFDPSLREQWERAVPERLPNGEWGQDRCCSAPGGPWGPIRWKSTFDLMRGIDFLCQHELVDSNRIGAIGHSLGADTIISIMPLEERIKAAAISGGGLVAPEPGFTPYGMPYADILKLIAPRPFLEVTGVYDYANFSGDETIGVDQRMAKKRAAHDSAMVIYQSENAPEALACFEHDGGHTFPEAGRREAYTWLKRWLMGGDG